MHAIAMKCPGCGAGLEVAADMDNFACGYCRTSITAVRRGGTVSLLENALTSVQVSTDRIAAELALVRLKSELAQIDLELGALAFFAPYRGTRPFPPSEPHYLPTHSNLWLAFQRFFSEARYAEKANRKENKQAREKYLKELRACEMERAAWKRDKAAWELDKAAWERSRKDDPVIKELEKKRTAILGQLLQHEAVLR